MSRLRVTSPWSVIALACMAVAACTDVPTQLDGPRDLDVSAAYAKNGGGGRPSGILPATFTINTTNSLSSDRPYPYVDGVDGVVAVHQDGDLATLAPAGGRCRGGCEPRWATVTFERPHYPDHVGEDETSFSQDLTNMKVRLDAGTLLINLVYCSWDQSLKKAPAGYGLRFDPDFPNGAGIPESNLVDVTATGAQSWSVASKPYPDNVAGCEKGTRENPITEYWHMNVDFNVAVVAPQ